MKLSFLTFLLLLLLIGVLIGLGFFREFLFVNINYQLYYLYYQTDYSDMSEHLSFLNDWTYYELYYLKWVITPIMMGFYFLVSLAFVQVVFKHRRYFRYVVVVYGGLVVVSAICFGLGYLLGVKHEGYKYARIFMGYAQSPFVIMILLPAFWKLGPLLDAQQQGPSEPAV